MNKDCYTCTCRAGLHDCDGIDECGNMDDCEKCPCFTCFSGENYERDGERYAARENLVQRQFGTHS